MSNLLQRLRAEAKKAGKCIVLPEGEDERIIAAAREITSEGLAKPVLIGDEKVIRSKCAAPLEGVRIVDPKTEDLSDYAQLLYDLRKHKGMDPDKARELVRNPLYLGVLMVQRAEADGMVAGAVNATGDVLRPALQIIKTAPGISTVSSCFIMVFPEDFAYGEKGVMVFGDCAVNPEPTAAQLCDIALASAESAKKIAGITPRVAMLSYSTKGSAAGEAVDKITEATRLARAAAPGLLLDGELQADAALVESVAKLKAKGSDVAGRANVLIFPDLQSGNIGYKLVQRLAGAEAIGPICQGFNKPVNDLSRGCSAADIVNVVAMTVLQSL